MDSIDPARGALERAEPTARAGEGRGATARVAFTLGKRSRGLIRTLTAPSLQAALRNGPGSLRHYVPKQGTALVAIRTARWTHAELRINGRLVADPAGALLMRVHRWNASANDGLRAGVNRIDVRAFDADGRYDRKSWTMTRPPALPLVEAGSALTTDRGRWTKLSARGSRPSLGAKGLTYAWRVVVKPEGSSPVLRNPTSATPSFKPDVRGYYEVALTVRDKTTFLKTAGRHLLAAASSLGAEDTVAVTAGPALLEQGLWVDTTLAAPTTQAPNGALTVNGIQYPLSTGSAGGDVAVQLDATMLQEVATGSIATLPPAYDTITIRARDVAGASGLGAVYTELFLGMQPAAQNGSQYSYIPDPAGYALKGWLQPATATSAPTWVGAGDAISFTTRAQGSAANNTIFAFGGQQVTATLASGSTTGFALLTLAQNGGAEPVQVFSFPGASNPAGNQAVISALRGALENLGQLPSTFMLQSIGPIEAPDSSVATAVAWAGLGSTIATFHGNADVFYQLDGSQDPTGGSYALVAHANPPYPVVGVEASQERTKSGGSISGLFMRAWPDGNYEPVINDSSQPDPSGSSRYDFLPFLYGPPTDWSNWMRDPKTGALRAPTSGESAALASIVSSAIVYNWVPTTPLCQGAPDAIRGYYCDVEATDLTSLATRIANLSFDASNANGFTSTDFSNVRASLVSEVTDVADVRAGIAEYQTLFGTDSQTGSVDAAAIAQTIKTQVHAAAASVTSNTYGMMTTTMTLMSADPDIDDLMTFVGGLFMLESLVLPNSTPTPSLPNQVELTQATAASELTNDYNQASINLDTYGDYLVQDPVKLMQGAQLLSVGRYAVTSGSKSALLDYAEYGTKQWLWGTILGTSYTVWKAPAEGYARNITCLYGTNIVNPFANVADSGYWGPPGHLGGDQWWIGIDYSSDPTTYVLENNAGLGQSVTDPLFSPIDPTKSPATQVNIGAAMPYFALTYLGSNQMMLSTGSGKNGCFE